MLDTTLSIPSLKFDMKNTYWSGVRTDIQKPVEVRDFSTEAFLTVKNETGYTLRDLKITMVWYVLSALDTGPRADREYRREERSLGTLAPGKTAQASFYILFTGGGQRQHYYFRIYFSRQGSSRLVLLAEGKTPTSGRPAPRNPSGK
jgi:hypothetical protein